MIFRKEAKLKILQMTSLLSELWNDPFRHVHEASAGSCNQGQLIAFQRDYEELVEMLFEAQRYGPNTGNERRYMRLKDTLASQYQDLRPFLIAFLRFDVHDEKVGIVHGGMGADAFQATWAAASLQSFVASDDVFFSDRVTRAQDALKYYNDHLHCLGEAA